MKLAHLIVLSLTLGTCMVVAVAEDVESTEREGGRDTFKPPKLFDFGHYQQVFKKSYASFLEMVVRQRMFWARAMRSFLSAVRYKAGASSYYLKVNKFSDRTPQELEALRMQRHFGLDQMRTSKAQQSVVAEKPPLLSLKVFEETLHKASKLSNEDGFAQIVEELNLAQTGKRRKRRDTEADQGTVFDRELSLDELIATPDDGKENPEVLVKTQTYVPSNNPDYEEPETISFGAQPIEEDETEVPGPSEEELHALMAGDGGAKLAESEVAETADRLRKNKRDARGKKGNSNKKKPTNFMYIDHRESNCFFKPREQGDCGSCYAFATVGLMEHLHCMETGNLVALSEQYFVDCGRGTGLSGCNGGFINESLEFVLEYGAELRSNYPYRERAYECPYDFDKGPSRMGYFKFGAKSYQEVELDELELHLKHTPILVGIGTKGDFLEYGGGVHRDEKCGVEADHVVLLVGSGQEDGEDYWLMRNSYSTAFGESGYYKMSKNAPCIFGSGYFFGDKGNMYTLGAKKNRRNPSEVVKKRYEIYKRMKADFESS